MSDRLVIPTIVEMSQMLLGEIRQKLEDEIVRSMLESVEREIRPIMKEHARKVTFESIERSYNLLNMRDRLEIIIDFKP
jgi:hypothetical protein